MRTYFLLLQFVTGAVTLVLFNNGDVMTFYFSHSTMYNWYSGCVLFVILFLDENFCYKMI